MTMPREKQGYRDCLELLMREFPTKRMLLLREVAAFTGRDPRWCKQHLGVTKAGICITDLARAMCAD